MRHGGRLPPWLQVVKNLERKAQRKLELTF
jgi:hypothetical protein